MSISERIPGAEAPGGADPIAGPHGAVLAGIARIFREALTCKTETELGRACLAVAESVTASEFGFLLEVNAKSKLADVAVSDPGWEACRVTEVGHGRRGPGPLRIRGIYGRVILDGKGFFTNDPRSHPDRIGTPPGHPPIHAFLGVPLWQGGEVIGMLALANRPGGYRPEDLQAAEGLAPCIVQAFQSKRAEEALRDSDRRKSDFLALLSHELRNPLAPIRNSLYLLERVAPGSDAAGRALAVIQRQTQQLTRLTDDLLDVTRISRGKIRLKREKVDAADVVRRTCDDHQPLFRERGLRLSVSAPASPVWIDADPTRLTQVVGNLLQNAVKFTPAAGSAVVEVERAGAAAVIRVRDDGAGIEPAMLGRLFQPFVQAERTLARSNGGLGLGLAIVKGLVDLHGGSVAVDSAGPGRGAEFTITLPLASEVAAAGAKPRAQASGSRSVLLVEDNLDAAETLAELLESFGHHVRVAHDARGALGLARASPPEVVLCDIGLPDLDGYELARRLRSEGGLSSSLLVAITGYALPEDKERARAAGFDAHLAKPPSLEELLEILGAPSTSAASD